MSSLLCFGDAFGSADDSHVSSYRSARNVPDNLLFSLCQFTVRPNAINNLLKNCAWLGEAILEKRAWSVRRMYEFIERSTSLDDKDFGVKIKISLKVGFHYLVIIRLIL